MNRLDVLLAMGTAALIASMPTLAATTIQCPDISQAQQLVDCPAEADMKRMFEIHCGFERDPNAKKPELCDSYAEYKRRKFNALWESADKEFMGYVTCAVPAAEIKQAKPISVAVSQKNGLYKVSCKYLDGAKLNMRTRSVCRIPGVTTTGVVLRKNCEGDPSACQVECE